MNLYDDKNIIACSTGGTINTALDIIRISGKNLIVACNQFFEIDLKKIEAKKVYLTDLYNPVDNSILDNIVLTYYKGPNSFNGEDILELSVHGNVFNVENIINAFVKSKQVRLANPGEFSYRALKNKKLNLAQVEGLDLLLNANSNLMLSQGLDILHGELFNSYQDLYQRFIKLKAAVELSIDFLEDIGEENADNNFKSAVSNFEKLISSLNRRIQGDLSGLKGPSIVLAGAANAGKSTLFNQLLSEERSIVTNIAGTTRDFVSEFVHIDGVNFKLVDTAGIRDTTDIIEKEGINRSLKQINQAFIKILVINPLDFKDSDLNRIEYDLVIFTHADKDISKAKVSEISAKKIFLSGFGPIGPGKLSGPMGAKLSGPIEPDKLILEIENYAKTKYQELFKDNPILIKRHRESLSSIFEKFNKFKSISEETTDIAVISSELNILGNTVSELIGVVSPTEILNDIFSNFCIGK